MTDTSATSGAAPWQRLSRATGIAGLTAVVLIFAVLIGSHEEPAFSAKADAFLAHYQSPNTVASDVRSFVFTVALITLVWFVVMLSILLRTRRGRGAVAVVDRDGLGRDLRGAGPVRERGRCRPSCR